MASQCTQREKERERALTLSAETSGKQQRRVSNRRSRLLMYLPSTKFIDTYEKLNNHLNSCYGFGGPFIEYNSNNNNSGKLDETREKKWKTKNKTHVNFSVRKKKHTIVRPLTCYFGVGIGVFFFIYCLWLRQRPITHKYTVFARFTDNLSFRRNGSRCFTYTNFNIQIQPSEWMEQEKKMESERRNE